MEYHFTSRFVIVLHCLYDQNKPERGGGSSSKGRKEEEIHMH